MSLAEIEIHFKEMQQLSDEVGEFADKLQQFINGEAVSTIKSVKQVWQSENAEIFIKKGMKRVQAIEHQADNLRILSLEIQEKAAQIYEAEKRNELRAMTRRYF